MVFKTLISQIKLGVYAKTWGDVIGHAAASGWSRNERRPDFRQGLKPFVAGPFVARLKPCPSTANHAAVNQSVAQLSLVELPAFEAVRDEYVSCEQSVSMPMSTLTDASSFHAANPVRAARDRSPLAVLRPIREGYREGSELGIFHRFRR